MECVHCNWFSLSRSAEPAMPEGRCGFTGVQLAAVDLEADGVHACATKSMREWEHEQRLSLSTGTVSAGWPQVAAATVAEAEPDAFRLPEVPGVAAVGGNTASRPVVMLSAAEWRIGYAGHVRTRRDPGLNLRLSQAATA